MAFPSLSVPVSTGYLKPSLLAKAVALSSPTAAKVLMAGILRESAKACRTEMFPRY